MKIIPLITGSFNLNDDGLIAINGSYRLVAETEDENSSAESFAAQVNEFIGQTGDNWPIDKTTTPYILATSELIRISDFEYLAKLSGHWRQAEIRQLPSRELLHLQRDGARLRKMEFLVPKSLQEEWLPAIGDKLTASDDNFVVEEVTIIPYDNFCSLLTLMCRWQKQLLLNQITEVRNVNLEREKIATYQVPKEALEAFLSDNAVNTEAVNWAGNDYFITAINSIPSGKTHFLVTLTAKKISVRLIEVIREERFTGRNVIGMIYRDIVFTGRWRVRHDDRGDFHHLTGSSARSWAGQEATVVKIHEKRISDQEYEVTMQAYDDDSPWFMQMRNSDNNGQAPDNKRHYRFEMGEYFLTATHCGYRLHEDGYYITLGEWDGNDMCPLSTTSPLPKSMINAPVNTVILEETRYYRSDSNKLASDLVAWNNSGRIYNGKLAQITAGWLKEDQQTTELVDNKGRTWTKVVRLYRHPPASHSWNSNYWNCL